MAKLPQEGNPKFQAARVELDEKIEVAFDIHQADEKERNYLKKPQKEESNVSDFAKEIKSCNEKKDENKKKDEFIEGVIDGSEPETREISKARMDQIELEIVRAQREFVDIKLKKEKAFSGVYSYFKNIGEKNSLNIKVQKAIEDDKEIEASRQWYRAALESKRDLQLAEARKRGAKPEDLVTILLEFEDQRINGLAKTFDDVRTEHQEGKVKGKIGEGLTKMSKWYKEQPLKVKIGLAAVFIGAGFLVTNGLVAATMGKVIAGAIASRRGAMGMLAGTSTSLWAEKKTKDGREQDIQKRRNEFSESLKDMDENERMDLLMRKLQGISDNVDVDLDHMRYQNNRNLALGVSAGVASVIVPKFIGGYVGESYNWIREKLGFIDHASSSPSVATIGRGGSPVPSTTHGMKYEDFKSTNVTPEGSMDKMTQLQHPRFYEMIRNDQNLNHQIDMHASAAPTSAAEVLQTPTIENTIPIHGSVRNTLMEYLEKNHPGIKDKDYAVTQMVRDFVHDNPGKNPDMVFSSNGLVIDEHDGLKLKGIVGKGDWGHGHLAHHPTAGHGHVLKEAVKVETPTASEYLPTENVNEHIDKEVMQQWNHDIIRADQATLTIDNDKYQIASSLMAGQNPILDASSPNYQENLRYAQMLKEGAKRFNWAPAWESGRIGTVINHAQEHIQSLINVPDEKTFTQIGRDFFDNKKTNIFKFGGLNVRQVLTDPDSNLKGLSKEAKKLIVGYAASEDTKPKVGETFKVWSYRIMKIIKEKQVENTYDLAA